MSRYDRTVRRGFTAVLLLLGVCFAAQASAAPADALMPVEKYTTAKAKNLANAHRLRLIEFSEQIYNCMPWLAVYPGRIGFPRYKDSPGDDRYLSTWIWVDQREDPVFAALPQERRASAMFSRYGTDLLRRMASLQPLVADPNVQGFSVVLSWLKPGTGGAVQPVNETLALFADKQATLGFLAKRVSAGEFTRRAKFSVFDGVQDMGRLPLEVWEDSFVRTFKVANYEVPKGQKCSG